MMSIDSTAYGRVVVRKETAIARCLQIAAKSGVDPPSAAERDEEGQ